MAAVAQALIGLLALTCTAVVGIGLVDENTPPAALQADLDSTPVPERATESSPATAESAVAQPFSDPGEQRLDWSADPQPVPVPQPAAAPEKSPVKASPKSNRVLRRVLRVTAYCDRGTTASGTSSGVGQCAAPADIPFGSRVYIPKLGRTFVVTDRTHERFRHNTVDIFMSARERCVNFGRSYLTCEITVPPDYRVTSKGAVRRVTRR